MPPVQCTQGHQHITSGAPWVGGVSLLQNDDDIPGIPVEEMNLRCRPGRCPFRTPLDGAVLRYPGGQEYHPVGMCLPARGHGFPMPSHTRFLPMMRL